MNKNISQFIEITISNYNNFPLIDYDAIAEKFINKYIDLINKIKLHYDIANWPMDENMLINEFWTNVLTITNNQTEYDLICQIIIEYYFPIAKHINSIHQIIDIDVNDNKYQFYDINFFESDNSISQEALNNIQLFFSLYKETDNFSLLNRLEARYIYPLTDAINEYLIDAIVIQNKKVV